MYGIIYEHKLESPLIQESKPLNYDEACARIEYLKKDSNIIRMCIFKLKFESGNQSLIME